MKYELAKTTQNSHAVAVQVAVPKTSLQLALELSDSREVARVLTGLSEKKIAQELAGYKDDCVELERLRKVYAELAENPDYAGEVLESCKAAGLAVRARVEAYAGPRPIGQLMLQDAEDDIGLLLAHTQKFINVGQRLNEEQMLVLAAELAVELRSLTLEDVGLALKRGRDGVYGQLFRLDGAVVRDWVRKYQQERMEREREVVDSWHASNRGDRTYDRTAAERREKEEKMKKARQNAEFYEMKDALRDAERELKKKAE